MFAYAANNPVKYTDPDGKCPFLVVTGIAGAVIGAAVGAVNSYSETGSVDWKAVGKGALIGGAIGLGAGAAVSLGATALAGVGVTALATEAEIAACGTVIGGKLLAGITTVFGQKLLQQLNNANPNKINHILNGSKGSDHHWEKIVPNKNWNDIKNLIVETMVNGTESSYKSAFQNTLEINGNTVVVTFQKLADGTKAISDAWVQ